MVRILLIKMKRQSQNRRYDGSREEMYGVPELLPRAKDYKPTSNSFLFCFVRRESGYEPETSNTRQPRIFPAYRSKLSARSAPIGFRETYLRRAMGAERKVRSGITDTSH